MILAPGYTSHETETKPAVDPFKVPEGINREQLATDFWTTGIGELFQNVAVGVGICIVALAVWRQVTRARGGEGGGLPAIIKGIIPSVVGAFLLIQISWVWNTVVMKWTLGVIRAIGDTIGGFITPDTGG